MKTCGIFAAVFLVLLGACKKDKVSNPQNSLEGQWKLVTVKDKSTGSSYSSPTGSSRDIIINFKANSFSGQTLRNSFSDGSYTLLNGSDVTFGSFNMTKIAEDEWGGMFITVLHACYLQSVLPCRPSKISLQGNNLTIESPLRYDLTLIRN